MSKSPDLETQARAFASEISNLLNATVTNGVRVSSVLAPFGCIVGRSLTKNRFSPELIPLSIDGKPPRLSLYLMHTFTLDEHEGYLMALKSTHSVQLNPDSTEPLFSYDYDREPANRYPGAHMHVAAASADYKIVTSVDGCESNKLGDIHFPVGGKRYRPILEDLLEMLIIEGMAEGRPGWEESIAAGRSTWYKRQLKAAVRADPESARAALGI